MQLWNWRALTAIHEISKPFDIFPLGNQTIIEAALFMGGFFGGAVRMLQGARRPELSTPETVLQIAAFAT